MLDGEMVGLQVKTALGVIDGTKVGSDVEGSKEGTTVGFTEGASVGEILG